jgi:HSP20 family protein
MLGEAWFPFFDVTKTLDEMDRLFGAVRQPLGLRSVPRGTFPAVNVYEQGDTAVLTAEVPGLDPKDLDLTVLGDSVTLRGERKSEAGEGERYYRRERPAGAFERTLTLPAPINPDSVQAEYRNGILRVRMEKAEQAKVKKVAIKS